MSAQRGSLVALVTVAITLAACQATGSPTSTAPAPTATTSAASAPQATPSPAPTPSATANPEWPAVRTSCAEAAGDPWLLVGLGTSESAGPGKYPELYADILCEELGRPVELHVFLPTEGLAPLAWWIDKVASDATIRADLAAADEVEMWVMSAHDVVPALILGDCRGEWPDPLKACIEKATANIPAETDELFGLIAGSVRDDAIVLAADPYFPPALLRQAWWDEPYATEILRMIDPYVEPMAAKYGFVFVDVGLVFNGPSGLEMPAAGLFASDGLHPSGAGALLTAQTFAEADGLPQ